MADYLKIPEVARRLDVSEPTVRRMVKSGKLPSVFVGGAYRVSEEDLGEYLERARVRPGGAASKKAEAPKRGNRPRREEDGEIGAEDVGRAAATIEGLRVIAREQATAWKKDLDRLEHGQQPHQDPGAMLDVAENLQQMFIDRFWTIDEAQRAGGGPEPSGWPVSLKESVFEAGANVQAMVEAALRVAEKSARLRSDLRGRALAEEFSVGEMPEELTGDPVWGEKLEEARAGL